MNSDPSESNQSLASKNYAFVRRRLRKRPKSKAFRAANELKQIQTMQNCLQNEAKPIGIRQKRKLARANALLQQPGVCYKILDSNQMDQSVEVSQGCISQESQQTSQDTKNWFNETWDFALDEVRIVESLSWLKNYDKKVIQPCESEYLRIGSPKCAINEGHKFCDEKTYNELQKAKGIFNEFNLTSIYSARHRANPFEQIGSALFMNRAALKMANIDSVTGFLFTKVDENTNGYKGPFYFADLCSGPGAFSEYILWRRKLFFKGFGLTLKNENDFKLHQSKCASQSNFRKLYGKAGDGNICNPDNIADFVKNVMFDTDSEGVHFVMADGGFSVEGNEEHQEILSKNLYICQCLVALEVLRENGHFVTKLFDIFTNFSVGLLYLMYNCFEKVTILKPNTSRPANAERYFICYNRRHESKIMLIKQYLRTVVNRLWDIKDIKDIDIIEIVPFDLIQNDRYFFKYIYNINMRLAKRQIRALCKIRTFCQNPLLTDPNHGKIEKRCLDTWKIPMNNTVNSIVHEPRIMLKSIGPILQMEPRKIDEKSNFDITFSNLNDWYYCTLYNGREANSETCDFYVCTSLKSVKRYNNGKWTKLKKIFLTPGTILYGELVLEKIVRNDSTSTSKPSLHVIDALRLGNMNLSDMSFTERMELIEVYCKSLCVNIRKNQYYVRPKIINKLNTFLSNPLIHVITSSDYYCDYRTYFSKHLALDSQYEFNSIASILFLKTNECMNVYDYQSFESTFILRVQLHFRTIKSDKEDQGNTLPALTLFSEFVKNKLSIN